MKSNTNSFQVLTREGTSVNLYKFKKLMTSYSTFQPSILKNLPQGGF